MRTQAKSLGSHPTILFFGKPTKPLGVLLLVLIVLFKTLLIGSDGIEEYHPKDVPTKKRWAVMIAGAGRTYMLTRNSFLQNVVKQSNPPMDVFVFTKNISNSSCLVELESMRLLEIDSTMIYFDDNYLEGEISALKNTEDRFVRQHTEAFQMIDDYAEQQNIKYEFVFFARPDIYYTLPFNIKELEKKFINVTDGINGTVFSPECCAWGGWCDQLAAAPYKDFARMIRGTSEWFSRGSNAISERAFQERGQFANLSNFDMGLKKDYGFLILRLTQAIEACHGSHYEAYWTDNACNNFAPFEFNATLKTCEFLNSSSVCDKNPSGG